MAEAPVLTQQEQEGFRRRILRLRQHLVGQHKMLSDQSRSSQGESLGELSAYDNHPGDLGTETFQRSRDGAALQMVAARLQQVEEALARLRAGLYGQCANCRQFIGRRRLEAMPETIYCINCAQQRMTDGPVDPGGRRRPVEEELLRPALARVYGFNEDQRVAYDEEDAWQDVARYGTSSSLPDPPGSENVDRTD